MSWCSTRGVLLASGVGRRVDIAWASAQTGGLGIFIRLLAGLDRHAAIEAFGAT